MEIEIVIIDEDAIVIKGLPSAEKSRTIAAESRASIASAKEEYKKRIIETLIKEKFREKVLEDIIRHINWSSKAGKNEIYETGYGNTRSPLRCSDSTTSEAMEEIIKEQIFPILKSRGYRCKVESCWFSSGGKYLNIKISW